MEWKGGKFCILSQTRKFEVVKLKFDSKSSNLLRAYRKSRSQTYVRSYCCVLFYKQSSACVCVYIKPVFSS